MKKYFIILFALLASSPAFSQKKGKEDKKNAQPDSVTQVIDTAAIKTDSLTTVTDTPSAKAVADTAAVKADSVSKVTVTTTVVAATTTVVAATTVAKADTVSKAAATNSTQIDSLTKMTNLLTAKFNTVNAELEKYRVVYTVIKEKVLKRDFEPEQFAQIVDSIVASRDSTQFGFAAVTASFKDSLAVLQKEIATLKVMVDAAKAEDTAKLKLANELKMLKDLLDSKIITQTEFDIKKTLVLQKWK